MGVEPSIVCQESRFKFQLSIIVRNGDLTMKVAQIVDFINPRYFLLKNKDLVMLVATDKAEQSPTATPRARLVGQSTGPSGKKGHLWTLPTGECFVMYSMKSCIFGAGQDARLSETQDISRDTTSCMQKSRRHVNPKQSTGQRFRLLTMPILPALWMYPWHASVVRGTRHLVWWF